MQTAISSKITTPSPEHDLYWVELEKNSKSVKTLSSKHRLLCTEPYAQELYNLYVGKSTAVDNTVIKPGLVLSGKVVNITNKYVAVDIFNKDYVIVDNSNSDSKIISALTYGQNVQVAITEILDKPYTIKGSFSLASNINNYHIMSSYCNSSTPINVKIVSHIGPGYLVETNIDGTIIEAFLPNLVAGINKIVDAKTLIDQSFDVLVDSFSQERSQWVVSRKACLELLIPEAIKKLVVGEEVYQGIVTGTTNFGIFVEFNGCLTGMIHKANINPAYLALYDQIVPGMPTEFYIKEIIKGNKLILTQVLRETIWDHIKAGTVRVGSKLTGIVKEEKTFGLLVQLDEETLGLVHTSELSKLNIKYQPGDSIDVKISGISRSERKLNLSI